MPTGQEKNIFKWALQQLSFEMKYFLQTGNILFRHQHDFVAGKASHWWREGGGKRRERWQETGSLGNSNWAKWGVALFLNIHKKQPRPIDLLQIHVYTKTFFDENSREFPWSVVWSDEQRCPISSIIHTCSNSLMSRHQITEVQINNTNTDIQIHLLDLMSTPTCL